MNIFTNILGLLLASVLAENVFFCRCFFPAQGEEAKTAQSVLCAVMALPASAAGWLGHLVFAAQPELPAYLGAPVSIAIYIVVFVVLYRPLRALVGAQVGDFAEQFPRESFAFLPVGVLLLTCLGSYLWYESIIFGLGSGLGYLAAIWLYRQFKAHLKFSRPPFFLRGLPLQLIGIGLVSLAFFGLLGHSLTA